MLEALTWRNPVRTEVGAVRLYDDNTIPIRCANMADVEAHVLAVQELTKLRTWTVALLLGDRVVVKVGAEAIR